MTPPFLAASLAGDQITAERLLGLTIPAAWFVNEQGLMQLRLAQLHQNPTLQPWLLRAIGLRQTKQMVGFIGCHAAPDADYLRAYAPDGVEFGYTVFPEFRRQGYAREALLALMDWAQRTHQVPRFVVSISPQNVPSRRLAEGLGFRKVGEQMDEEDGLEEIFVCETGRRVRG